MKTNHTQLLVSSDTQKGPTIFQKSVFEESAPYVENSQGQTDSSHVGLFHELDGSGHAKNMQPEPCREYLRNFSLAPVRWTQRVRFPTLRSRHVKPVQLLGHSSYQFIDQSGRTETGGLRFAKGCAIANADQTAL